MQTSLKLKPEVGKRYVLKYWPMSFKSYREWYVRTKYSSHGEFILRDDGSFMEWPGSYRSMSTHTVSKDNVIDILFEVTDD